MGFFFAHCLKTNAKVLNYVHKSESGNLNNIKNVSEKLYLGTFKE